jgi:alanine dehydrogenase
VVVDEWEQASHNGYISRAVDGGALGRDDVTELGRILAGEANGRAGDDEITVFDSTGLAVQDLAVAVAVYEKADESGMDVPTIDL